MFFHSNKYSKSNLYPNVRSTKKTLESSNSVHAPSPHLSENHSRRFSDHVSGYEKESKSALSFLTSQLEISRSQVKDKKWDSFSHLLKHLNAHTFDSLTYSQQTMVILVMHRGTSSYIETLLSRPNDIREIFLIERTSGSQGYAVGDLDGSPHFTLLTKDLPDLLSGLAWFKDDPTSVLFIPSSVSYFGSEKKVKVVNGDQAKYPLLSTIHSSFMDMFRCGLSHKFTLSDFGRGDVLKESESFHKKISLTDRSIPTISIGFGTQDCTRYSSSRTTIAGNYKPYISDGGLSKEE